MLEHSVPHLPEPRRIPSIANYNNRMILPDNPEHRGDSWPFALRVVTLSVFLVSTRADIIGGGASPYRRDNSSEVYFGQAYVRTTHGLAKGQVGLAALVAP